jgi:hypothetical protein
MTILAIRLSLAGWRGGAILFIRKYSTVRLVMIESVGDGEGGEIHRAGAEGLGTENSASDINNYIGFTVSR